MSDNKPCKCNGKLYQMGYIGRVGGYIEFVNTQYGDMIVNEEGLLHGLPVNDVASLLAGKQIVGRVLMEVKEELEK